MIRAKSRGFTLIELMVVVIIVGIVATIAVVAYRKHVTSSKVTEATGMVGDIREAQERYKSEVGAYADVSSSITSLYPNASPGQSVTAWGGACSSCNANQSWANLNVRPSGPVRFGYATVAGDAATDPSAKAGGITIRGQTVSFTASGTKPTGPWFVAYAQASGPSCKVVGSSFTNQLAVDDQCD